MKSYDYAHRQGVVQISWQDFSRYSATLAVMVAKLHPEIILGIARAGLFPATAVACWLQTELYPVRITRRLNDQVVYSELIWKTPVPDQVAGKVTVVIDEIADTGETLALVAHTALAKGAASVSTACLFSHTWANPKPDFVAMTSNAFIIFPWDSQRLIEGKWQINPEVAAGLQVQSK